MTTTKVRNCSIDEKLNSSFWIWQILPTHLLDSVPAKSASVKFRESTELLFTSSPRAAKRSSMLPGSPNHPRWSAIRCRLLHPLHRATTTPFSYDSRQTVLMDLVSQTLQVNIMARSCREETFKLEVALNLTAELESLGGFERHFDESESGLNLEASGVSTSSLAGSLGWGDVCILLLHISSPLKKEFADERNCHECPASNRFSHPKENRREREREPFI